MPHISALFSLIFMIAFVSLYDRLHLDRVNQRFCRHGLLSREEVERIQGILVACQE